MKSFWISLTVRVESSWYSEGSNVPEILRPFSSQCSAWPGHRVMHFRPPANLNPQFWYFSQYFRIPSAHRCCKSRANMSSGSYAIETLDDTLSERNQCVVRTLRQISDSPAHQTCRNDLGKYLVCPLWRQVPINLGEHLGYLVL